MPSIVVPQPKPLGTCPGRVIWERYRGEQWLVFVDESFFMFFELTAKSGYFCYAAVGVPEREYSELKTALEPAFRRFAELAARELDEFKHSEFKRIDYRDRRKLALQLRDALAAHGAFVAGFYTPVRSFVLERVRLNLMDEAEQIPEQQSALEKEAVAQLRAEHNGPGQSAVIQELLWLPVVAVANLLAAFECSFRIVCDPREKKEDKCVRAAVSDWLAATRCFQKVPAMDLRGDLDNYFRGIESDRSSDQELGLQLADLMVGEVSEFFKANEDLLTYAASKRLVTPTSQEAVNTVTRIEGRLFKTGVLHKMPSALQARFFRPDPQRRTVLHLFRDLLAAGMLTCYSAFGQPRDIMPFERLIWDQCE